MGVVCHEADGAIREYNDQGHIVWDYEVPLFGKERKGGHGPEAFGNKAFCALRLDNGNTLIATGNGHSVLEVTPGKEIVWQIRLPARLRSVHLKLLEHLALENFDLPADHGLGQL